MSSYRDLLAWKWMDYQGRRNRVAKYVEERGEAAHDDVIRQLNEVLRNEYELLTMLEESFTFSFRDVDTGKAVLLPDIAHAVAHYRNTHPEAEFLTISFQLRAIPATKKKAACPTAYWRLRA